MRRLRREVTQFGAAESRLTLAIAFSAALHAGLIWSLAPQTGNRGLARPVPIQARVVQSEPAPAPTRPLPRPILRSPGAHEPIPLPVAAETAHAADAIPGAQSPDAETKLELPGLPEAPDLVHYAAKDLDVFPQLQAALRPDYPQSALQQKIPGTVTLLVLVDEAGRVSGVSVVDAAPQGLFDDSAQQALAGAAFMPAQREGRKVRSRILVNVSYDPDKP